MDLDLTSAWLAAGVALVSMVVPTAAIYIVANECACHIQERQPSRRRSNRARLVCQLVRINCYVLFFSGGAHSRKFVSFPSHDASSSLLACARPTLRHLGDEFCVQSNTRAHDGQIRSCPHSRAHVPISEHRRRKGGEVGGVDLAARVSLKCSSF
jgi:hypothetical protein